MGLYRATIHFQNSGATLQPILAPTCGSRHLFPIQSCRQLVDMFQNEVGVISIYMCVCVQEQGFATTSNDSIMVWWNRSLPTAASALAVCPLLSRRVWCGGDAAQQGDKPPQPVFQPLNLYNQIVKSYDSKAAAYRDLGANMRIKSHCARVFKSRSTWSLMYLPPAG